MHTTTRPQPRHPEDVAEWMPCKTARPWNFGAYAYRRGAVWEAICTDLDVATCGSSQEEVKRLLAEAIDLHLESAAGFPGVDRQAMLSRRAPWNVRFGLELLSRVHGIRSKWGKGGEKVRHSFVVHHEIPAPEWAERNEAPIDDAERTTQTAGCGAHRCRTRRVPTSGRLEPACKGSIGGDACPFPSRSSLGPHRYRCRLGIAERRDRWHASAWLPTTRSARPWPLRPPCLARHSGLKIPKDDGTWMTTWMPVPPHPWSATKCRWTMPRNSADYKRRLRSS